MKFSPFHQKDSLGYSPQLHWLFVCSGCWKQVLDVADSGALAKAIAHEQYLDIYSIRLGLHA